MTDPARLFYLLATDDDPVPRIASFGSMFPDGIEHGTTSEEVALLDVAHVHHAGAWAVVRCDLRILDAARMVDPLASGDDATLAAAYLSSRAAGRERQLVAAAIRQLGRTRRPAWANVYQLGPGAKPARVDPGGAWASGDFAIGDDRMSTAPVHGPIEVTPLGDIRPPSGMVAAPRLRNDVGPAFVPSPDLAAALGSTEIDDK